MIEAETKIFQLIFPPTGAVPLDRLDMVPLIRNHIASILDLANGHEQQFLRGDESAAITAKVVELRDTPGPDGLAPTWETIATLCNTTKGGARKRYATYKKMQTFDRLRERQEAKSLAAEQPELIEAAPLQEAEPAHPETHTEPAQKTEEPPTIRESLTVQPESPAPREAALANLERLKAEKEAKKAESLDPETLAEIDRMLAEGRRVQSISCELKKEGKIISWTRIRARAVYLARTKAKEAAPVAEEAAPNIPEEKVETKPEPISISRKELDLRIWDMWRAGKTLDEISDILYSEGLYYSAKSVRVRLLSQGATL